jgi:ethanolaminephosphotransferase
MMEPKLLEMDNVVKRVYESLEQIDRKHGSKSMLLLCGDHGMNEVSLLF